MRKSVLAATVLLAVVGFCSLNCGKSYCKQYEQKFCADEKSPACAQAKEKVKAWSSKECRIQLNTLEIEEQTKATDKLLE